MLGEYRGGSTYVSKNFEKLRLRNWPGRWESINMPMNKGDAGFTPSQPILILWHGLSLASLKGVRKM